MLITDVKRSFHCHSTALSRVNDARRRLKRGIKRPRTAGLHICRSTTSTVHLQVWFKGCSPVGGLLDKGWCRSLHNFIVHCRRHPHDKPTMRRSWSLSWGVFAIQSRTQMFRTTLLPLLLLLLSARICCACISWFCWCWSMKKSTSRRSGFMFTPWHLDCKCRGLQKIKVFICRKSEVIQKWLGSDQSYFELVWNVLR